jgi:hypothetical protein
MGLYVVFSNHTDECTYSYNVIYAICDDEVKAIEIQEEMQEQYHYIVIEISSQFEMNKIYHTQIPY